jgi:hypothetical protein
MTKDFARYMTYGKKVESLYTADTFKLIEDMSADKDTVKVVQENEYEVYNRLRAWERSTDNGLWERLTASGKTKEGVSAERKGMEQDLRIDAIRPCDKVRFITSDYKTLFFVNNFNRVMVTFSDGKTVVARVAYIDECHFTFVDGIAMNLYGGAFHICQFAEECERTGCKVSEVEKVLSC